MKHISVPAHASKEMKQTENTEIPQAIKGIARPSK
jgi:hypothetical protein